MSDNQLVNLSKRFAVDIVNICTKIKEEKKVANCNSKLQQFLSL